MGTIFKSVADAALQYISNEACQQCERSDVPIYDYVGEIVDSNLAANPDLARDEPQVSALCADCINGSNVMRTDRADVELIVQQLAPDPEKAWEEFNHLPDLPLFLQGLFDWPYCCDSWCEFTGAPQSFQELIITQQSHQYWEQGINNLPRNFKSDGPPESLREISKFACATCSAGYYTDQFT